MWREMVGGGVRFIESSYQAADSEAELGTLKVWKLRLQSLL